MDKMFVKMLKTFGEFAKDAEYEIDGATAKQWIDAELATAIESPVEDAVLNFQKALEDQQEKMYKNLTDTVAKATSKIPAVAKDHDESPSEFYALVGRTSFKDQSAREKAYNILTNKYTKTMTQGSNTAGGFLVPEEWGNKLLGVEGYSGPAFPDRVTQFTMATDTAFYPVDDQTVTPSGGSSAFYSGVTIGVVSEGSAPGASTQFATKQLALNAKKLMAYSEVSSELLENSPISVEQILNKKFSGAASSWINYMIFNGAGSSTELTGTINHASAISITRNTSNDVKLQDLAEMYSRLLPESVNNAIWVVNPLVLAKFPLLGNANHLVWINNGVNGAPVLTFMGRPIIASEALPSLGADGDVILADFSKYVVGLNKQIRIDASTEFKFTSDITTFRCRVLLDGKPMMTAPVKLQNGVDTVAWAVQLDHNIDS